MILEKKKLCGKKELVGGIWGEELFWEFHQNVAKLEFEDKPDYEKLKAILN